MSNNDRTELVKRLISVTGKLSVLVQRENEALQSPGAVSELKDIVSEKQQLGHLYEEHLKGLGDEENLSEVDPDLRRRLKEAVVTFNGLLDENRARLEAKIEASRHLFEVIAECAKDHQGKKKAGVYGQSGSVDQPARQAYGQPLSVGLNQEF